MDMTWVDPWWLVPWMIALVVACYAGVIVFSLVGRVRMYRDNRAHRIARARYQATRAGMVVDAVPDPDPEPIAPVTPAASPLEVTTELEDDEEPVLCSCGESFMFNDDEEWELHRQCFRSVPAPRPASLSLVAVDEER